MANHPIFADDMQEIVESFVIETKEIFDELDNELLQLEQTPEDDELIDRIFRAVHTVKGTSGFLSLDQLSSLTHHFEDVLNRLRRHELTFHPSMMDVMFAAFDQMKVLVQQVIDQNLVPIDLSPNLEALDALAEGRLPQPAAAAPPPAPEPAPEPVAEPQAVAEPAAEPAPEASAEPAPEASAPEAPEAVPAADAAPAPAAGPSPADDAEDDGAEGGTGGAVRKRSTETIRVEVERLDSLMDLVGELVLGRNRLLQIVSDMGTQRGDTEDLLRELADTNAQVDFITTELQAAVMHTRMVQIGRVFNKFPRVVRDLAKEFDKQIDLEVEGKDTELDKSLIEEIGDPLVHLIRNAADHGVERPDVREAAGKPPRGTIRLSAAHEGNHVVIEIQDDGAGINADVLKAKAVEKGLLTDKEAADMSEQEAYNLIFRPGFSTAQQVSHVSGRGVGMDVVKTNITRLNGTIQIQSELGKGTRFTLKLPLTLAIIQSLLVRVGGESFAIPLHNVSEVVGLEPDEVQTIRGRSVIRLREQVLPLVRVADAMSVQDAGRADGRSYAVIVGVAHHRIGLVVDDLIGQKEIVIKPLDAYLKKIAGIAGSTILGDGRVIMILDVAELFRMENERVRGRADRTPEAA